MEPLTKQSEPRHKAPAPEAAPPAALPGLPITIGALLLLGLYTNLGLSISGRYIPGLLTIGAGFLAFIRLNSRLRWGIAAVLGFEALGLLTNVVLTQQYGMDVLERLFSAGLLTLSLGVFFSTAMLLASARAEDVARLHRLFLILAPALAIGLLLEASGLLRPVSDAVRRALYSGSFIYDSAARDLRDFGAIRPNLFTQEPSHLAKMVGLTGFALFALRPSRRALAASLLLFALGLVFIRSASLLPPLILTFVLAAIHGLRLGRYAEWIGLGLSLAFLLGAMNVDQIAALVPGSRAERIALGADASAIERFMAPVSIAQLSLAQNPFFGIGIGTKEHVTALTVEAYSRFPHYDFSRYLGAGDIGFGWYNALFEGVATLGGVGFVWVLAPVGFVFGWRRFALFLLPFTMVFLLDSGFPAPRSWGYAGLYFALLLLSLDRAQQPEPSEGLQIREAPPEAR